MIDFDHWKDSQLDPLKNSSPATLLKVVENQAKTIWALSAGLVGMIKLSRDQQLLVPRHLVKGYRPDKDRVFVSLVGTRYCYKHNDSTPGTASKLWTPPGFKGGNLSE